jgi:hypothetical protein
MARIVIEMRGGQHDARCPLPHHLLQVGPAGGATTPVAPRLPRRIVPSPIRQAAHSGAVRPAAALAHAVGTLEADASTEFAPMRRIEVAKLPSDRHDRPYFSTTAATLAGSAVPPLRRRSSAAR